MISLSPFAQAKEGIVETDSLEALEMIAQRMQSLSAGLDHMPEPPRLNRTIELPFEEEPAKADDSLSRETGDPSKKTS